MSALSYSDRRGLQNEIERDVGKLSMEFSQLETAISCAIGFLAKVEVPVGHILTAEMSFKGKVGLFCALFQHRAPKGHSLDSLLDWRKMAEKLERERNQLIHSIYWLDPARAAALIRIKSTAKPKNGLMIQREAISTEETHALVENIKGTANEVGVLMRECHPDYGKYLARFYAAFSDAPRARSAVHAMDSDRG